jgi:hypothetical protein
MSQFTVHKYPLTIAADTVVELPSSAIVLHVGQQNGVPMMWVRKDYESSPDLCDRTFSCMGTGWSMVEVDSIYYDHIGTVQIGDFVWHYFEKVDLGLEN